MQGQLGVTRNGDVTVSEGRQAGAWVLAQSKESVCYMQYLLNIFICKLDNL